MQPTKSTFRSKAFVVLIVVLAFAAGFEFRSFQDQGVFGSGFIASSTSGSAPLTVTFSLNGHGLLTNSHGIFLEFGDGTSAQLCPPAGMTCQNQITVTHTYSAGDYQATINGANFQTINIHSQG